MLVGKCLVFFCVVLVHSPVQAEQLNDVIVAVKTVRNQTGHWITQVSQEHDSSTTCQSEMPVVEIETSASRCGQPKSTYQVKVTITSPPTPCGPTPATTESPTPLLLGYRRIKGVGCYHYHTAAETWPAAKELCELMHGHLVVINSEQEHTAILNLTEQNKDDVTGTEYKELESWAGVRESNTTQGEFFTVLGDPLSSTGFTRWHAGRPRESSLGDFVYIYSGAGGFADVPVSFNWKLPFACELRGCSS